MPYKDLEAHRAEMNAYSRAYYAAHRTEMNAYSRAYHAAHRAEILTRKRLHYPTIKAAHAQKRRAWYFANREKVRAYNKNYQKIYRSAMNAYARGYYATHLQARLKKRVYERQHKTQIRANKNKWRSSNIVERREKERLYRLTHHDHIRANWQRRRARLRAAPINDLTAAQWTTIKKHYDFRCVYCGRKMQRLTQDHITPLSRGGSNTVQNVVPACHRCNSIKHTGPPLVAVQPLLFAYY